MKLSVKFFIWLIEIKTKKLNSKDKIVYLLNELLKALQETGELHVRKSDGFGSANIWIHNANKESEIIVLEDAIRGWKYETKPTFLIKQE